MVRKYFCDCCKIEIKNFNFIKNEILLDFERLHLCKKCYKSFKVELNKIIYKYIF